MKLDKFNSEGQN